MEVKSPTVSDLEARAAHFEREENFRWLSSLFASTSPHTLSERLHPNIQQSIYALAEFAEIAHGSLDPAWILAKENRVHLGAEGFPLENYPTLTGTVDGDMEPIELVGKFYGIKGGLQGYCALRMSPSSSTNPPQVESNGSHNMHRPQIVLAFSGTSNARLALYDVMVASVSYETSFIHPSKREWKVHDGFQRVYGGVRKAAFEELKLAIAAMNTRLMSHDNQEWDLVITAHSLGAAVSYLVLLDILHSGIGPDHSDPLVPILPVTTRVTIAVFGSPRVGNSALVNHYRQLIEEWRRKCGSGEALNEWSVIGHMDGVPALPPTFFGYAHFSEHPYYSYGGHLYVIPESENEYTNFKVSSPDGEPVLYSRGGHNYYGARDMERLQRRLKGIFTDLALSSPTFSRLGSQLPDRQSISDGADWFKKKRIRLSKRRAVSFSGKNAEFQSPISLDYPDEAANAEGSSGPESPAVTMNPRSEMHGKSWIEGYLERERAEEAAWEKRNDSLTVRGVLRRVVSSGASKKPQPA